MNHYWWFPYPFKCVYRFFILPEGLSIRKTSFVNRSHIFVSYQLKRKFLCWTTNNGHRTEDCFGVRTNHKPHLHTRILTRHLTGTSLSPKELRSFGTTQQTDNQPRNWYCVFPWYTESNGERIFRPPSTTNHPDDELLRFLLEQHSSRSPTLCKKRFVQ